jgi:hypothetical protein
MRSGYGPLRRSGGSHPVRRYVHFIHQRDTVRHGSILATETAGLAAVLILSDSSIVQIMGPSTNLESELSRGTRVDYFASRSPVAGASKAVGNRFWRYIRIPSIQLD